MPVLSACQISREGEDGSVPVTLHMARDSGAIEEAADYVLGMWRPDIRDPIKGSVESADRGKVLVRILKNRSGRAHEVAALRLDPVTLRMTDW